MSKRILLEGIIAYPITPFRGDDAVDIELFRTLVERLVSGGAHAIAPPGSTGVLPYLDDEEKECITEAAIAQVAGRVPVMIGVSALTTATTVYHARFAEQAGADAVMIMPMSYWKLTDEEIFLHYAAVADKIGLPIMAYNNPATSGIDMSPALLKRLLRIPNVTMIKESTGDVRRMHSLRRALGPDVAFYNGSNPLALAAFAAGAKGWCTAAPALIPDLNQSLYAAVLRNDLRSAADIFYRQLGLLEFIVSKGLPRAVAAGLDLIGERGGCLRAPLQPLSGEDLNGLKVLLRECGVRPTAD